MNENYYDWEKEAERFYERQAAEEQYRALVQRARMDEKYNYYGFYNDITREDLEDMRYDYWLSNLFL